MIGLAPLKWKTCRWESALSEIARSLPDGDICIAVGNTDGIGIFFNVLVEAMFPWGPLYSWRGIGQLLLRSKGQRRGDWSDPQSD